jgi:hypothetical protein
MQVIDGVLTAGTSFKNVFRSVNENKGTNCQKDSHDYPEEGHEYDATSTLEDSCQDQVAVE